MAYAEFYNLNAHISYPFITTGSGTFPFESGGALPNSAVGDCGFTLGPRMNYDPEVGAVYLHSVARSGNNVIYKFRAVPTDGVDQEFTFVRDKDAPFGSMDYAEATGGPLYGVGFLVTGDVLALYDLLAPAEERLMAVTSVSGLLPVYAATVEQALVISHKKHAVLTVSVGNMLRLDDQPCGDCGYSTPIDNKTVKLQAGAANMIGNIRFRPGYNLAVNVSKDDNTISLNAVSGEGLGSVCDVDLTRYDGDVPYSGARCRGFIFTINGVPPNKAGAFQIEGAGAFFVKPGIVGEIEVNSKIGQTTVCEKSNG